MIYLKPLGGLCNRMRSIDSMISWCTKYKQDLTVIWVKDASLNCSFEDLFEMPVLEEFNMIILDCPSGFPELYPSLGKQQNSKIYFDKTINQQLVRGLKNFLKGRSLSLEQKGIRNTIGTLEIEATVTNDELADLYDSTEHVNSKTAREMDLLFIPQVGPLLENLMNNGEGENVYISSCYRMFPIENAYKYFAPVFDIKNKVKNIVERFDETIGLHIRRSDHTTSKAISTTDKFIEIVNNLIANNTNTTFFVSTDDEHTKGELMKKFGQKIITNQISSYDRNNANAVKEAVIDLYCLSNTKIIYGSHHSSFSQTAADIGGIEEITAR